MKIGITCYPTYGGSGVVATELGIELAARGHEIHFISYAPPVRLNPNDTENIQFHEVEVATYPLFEHAPYTLTLAVKMLEVASSRPNSICCTSTTPSRIPSARCSPAPWPAPTASPRRLPFITTLHGTDITLVGNDRSFLPITKFSIEQSDGVTAISPYSPQGHDRGVRHQAPHRSDSQLRELRSLLPQRPIPPCAPNGPPTANPSSCTSPISGPSSVLPTSSKSSIIVRKLKCPPNSSSSATDPSAATSNIWCARRSSRKDVFLLGKARPTSTKNLGVADLFLLPSDLESFGLAALEAMACEVPVVATNVGGVPDVVEHGVDGYLVTPRDVVSAAATPSKSSPAPTAAAKWASKPASTPRKILRQRRHPALRSVLSQRARKRRRRARRVVTPSMRKQVVPKSRRSSSAAWAWAAPSR
jgi:L-malate glycosyltransferase